MTPIAITGRGIRVANASTVSEFSDALAKSRSGIGPVGAIDASAFECRQAGEVRDLADDGHQPRGRVFQLLRSAVAQAAEEAGRGWLTANAERTGIVVGSTSGSSDAKESLARRYASPPLELEPKDEAALLRELSFESLYASLAEEYGLGGPLVASSVSCTSGGGAVALASMLLETGQATAMLAAACDTVSLTAYSGFAAVRAMTHGACRPFDRDRDGMMMGEGAAAFMLEPSALARARKAHIYAEILGVGCCNDAYHSVMPHPKGEGLSASVLQALALAGLTPDAIDVIFAHGTATRQNDSMERAAYRAVFGERLREIPLVAVKPLTGHTLGAAGAVELTAALCALEGGFVPATLGNGAPEDGCPLWLVRDRPLKRELRTALCCNAAFAGNNTAVVVRRPAEGHSPRSKREVGGLA